MKGGYQHTREPSWPQWLSGPWFCNSYSEEEFWLSILNSDVLRVHCARVVHSSPPSVPQNVLTVHCARVVQSTLCASGFLYAPLSPLSSLFITQIFYTNFVGVTSVIQLMNNCMASNTRYLQNVGTYLKNHVASHPDDSNV